jgi:hypothetical protein
MLQYERSWICLVACRSDVCIVTWRIQDRCSVDPPEVIVLDLDGHMLCMDGAFMFYLFSAEEEISPLHRPWLGLMLRRLPLLTASISESR